MPVLNISQSEFELESKFRPRLWSLHHDVPLLYEALLYNLASVGLSSVDLRPDAGDGSVGGRGLAFWLFGFNADVRITLESFRFRCASLARVARSQAIEAVGGVMTAIEHVSKPNVTFASHTIVYSCHGQIQGVPGAEFIRRFVPSSPTVKGFGDRVGAGTAAYYGEAPPLLSSILTLDPSRVVQGGLFVRVLFVTDGTLKSARELDRLAVERVSSAFASIDLEPGEFWS